VKAPATKKLLISLFLVVSISLFPTSAFLNNCAIQSEGNTEPISLKQESDTQEEPAAEEVQDEASEYIDEKVAEEEETYPAESTKITLKISYNFELPGKTEKIEFITLVPDNYYPRQKVHETLYSITPAEIFKSDDNNYARFVLDDPKDSFVIDIISVLELFRYDMDTASQISNFLNTGLDISESYTRQENYIEKDSPLIQEACRDFKEKKQIDLIRQIYDFVLDNMSYSGYNPGDLGAVAALNAGRGDCTEYSDLFIALCRARYIPARFIEGYTIDMNNLNIGHNWTEVYTDDYGWLPFDPTYDDTDGTTFEKLRNIYIYLSFIRNDDILNYYHFYYYTYRGDSINVSKNIEVY